MKHLDHHKERNIKKDVFSSNFRKKNNPIRAFNEVIYIGQGIQE